MEIDTTLEEPPEQPVQPSRHKRRMGSNVFASILLAAALIFLLNLIAYRHNATWFAPGSKNITLSEKTARVFETLDSEVDIIVFYEENHPAMAQIRPLMDSYLSLSRGIRTLGVHIEYVDPRRDFLRTKSITGEFDVKSPNIIIVRSGNRHIILENARILAHEQDSESDSEHTRSTFNGEQVISSAIYNVSRDHQPRVYFLTGHGERDPSSFHQYRGYTRLAWKLISDNIQIRPLSFDDSAVIPTDCDALVIAGPTQTLPSPHVALLEDYMKRNGRLLLLLDAMENGESTGLESLLESLGVMIRSDLVIGKGLREEELIVSSYPSHPITRSLNNTHSTFFLPRSTSPITQKTAGPDATHLPTVTVLARSAEAEWAESDFSTTPATFDETEDLKGPIPIALAVERGALTSLDVDIPPARMVVIGDSSSVANDAMRSGFHSATFVINSINWLIDRPEMLNIGSHTLDLNMLAMRQEQVALVRRNICYLMPAIALALALLVWISRRN